MSTTDPDLTDVEESLLANEESPPPRELFKPHPALMTAIVTTVFAVIEQNQGADDCDVIYMTVRQFIKSTLMNDVTPEDILSTTFAYYLESYRAVQVSRRSLAAQPANASDPEDLTFYNEAVLSLFDLYLRCPQDGTVRRMLPLATHAIHEVITTRQSANEDLPMGEVISYLSTVAMLSQTISGYVKGRRRSRNSAYITWLKGFLTTALKASNLSFMKDDAILKSVTTQVTNRKTVIDIPH